MKADSLKISKVFQSGGDIHYVLPHFQRQYSWGRENWVTLLDDALAIYDEYTPKREPEHFLGSLVVINDGTKNGTITAFKLIDGQQRLTTISLLFAALRDLIKESEPKTAAKIQRFLTNDSEEGDIYFKVLPTNKYGDRNAYMAILRNERLIETESLIPSSYSFFKDELNKKLEAREITGEKFFSTLSTCFQVVFIELNKDESPYKIFESLNSKGKPLTQADLARNYIAMRLPTSKQEKIFNEHWGKIENLLQESRTVGRSRLGELTAFMRHYLAMQSHVLCSENHIYARFRDRCEAQEENTDFPAEIATLRRFAEYYNYLLRPKHEKDSSIQNALLRLNVLEVQTAYPFLMRAYDEFKNGVISKDDFIELLNIVENYMVRRYLCGENTNSTNKMYPILWRDIKEEMEDDVPFIDAVKNSLLSKNYPSDEKVRKAIAHTKIYTESNREKICLILDSINKHLSKSAGGYTVLDNKPTIEHIMPQKLSNAWQQDLGLYVESTYRDHLHSLGNLTLVTQEWNTSMSNSAFPTKKEKLAIHALLLNSLYFGQINNISQWNSEEILSRASFLSDKFLEIWASLGEEQIPLPHGKPKAIQIINEVIEIPDHTWRQLRVLVVEWVIRNHENYFQNVMSTVKIFADNLEGKNKPKNYYRLSNGIWMYNSSSSKVHITYCRRILAVVGITEQEWGIIEEAD